MKFCALRFNDPRRWLFLLAAVLFACDDGSSSFVIFPPGGNAECEDVCRLGQKICSGGSAYVCGHFDEEPCTEWSEPMPCDYGCIEGECRPNPNCLDICSLADRICLDGGVSTCTLLEGCLQWSYAQPCHEPMRCLEGACVLPSDDCVDACEPEARTCVGQAVQLCETGADGCMQWSGLVACRENESCAGGFCRVNEPACSDACSAGAKACHADGLSTCALLPDGCFGWSAPVSCPFGCQQGVCQPDPMAWVPPCTTPVCPKVIDAFPYQTSSSTASSQNVISTYPSCSDANESGPEEYYVLRVTEPGTLVAGITESGSVDVDVHLLTALRGDACLARSDKGIAHHVGAGIYYISIDTYESSARAGNYTLYVTFLPDSGICGLRQTTIERVNTPSQITLPRAGSVVREAHMVTTRDQLINGTGWWPSSKDDKLAAHKQRTAEITGISYNRTESWCPAGEGGSLWGQGSTGRAVPEDAEAWYICMYWRSATRPAPGTRFLVINPSNGKAVVAAAGYETGPGDGARLGGAVEEVHQYCGTTHGSNLAFAEMIRQDLAYGPINCQP